MVPLDVSRFGDILLGDRAFGSFAHLTLLRTRGLHGTLNMDVLRSQTADGVRKEVQAFVLAYNPVRSVMATAGSQQGVPAGRIRFVDAVRWL